MVLPAGWMRPLALMGVRFRVGLLTGAWREHEETVIKKR